ncbi:Uncharacterised protein [Yersinia aleksiciae]|uniref:Uncharacterized protein n=1 Tax=Yersinia aleksiciae TaxID=263819 RepID=A0A0T9UYY8_YERAE|nr:Uncharacterised protein [Yersinia aleksiciae]CNL86515.1 Uncharacterised protein [Yersinia aleksiciae]
MNAATLTYKFLYRQPQKQYGKPMELIMIFIIGLLVENSAHKHH